MVMVCIFFTLAHQTLGLLMVPSITKTCCMCRKSQKNLLSIARLTCDNNAIVEFNSKFVFVKDKDSKKVLLRGMLKDGLYQVLLPKLDFSNSSNLNNVFFLAFLDTFSDPFYCFNSSISANKLWHIRSGHPAPLIMNKVA